MLPYCGSTFEASMADAIVSLCVDLEHARYRLAGRVFPRALQARRHWRSWLGIRALRPPRSGALDLRVAYPLKFGVTIIIEIMPFAAILGKAAMRTLRRHNPMLVSVVPL